MLIEQKLGRQRKYLRIQEIVFLDNDIQPTVTHKSYYIRVLELKAAKFGASIRKCTRKRMGLHKFITISRVYKAQEGKTFVMLMRGCVSLEHPSLNP